MKINEKLAWLRFFMENDSFKEMASNFEQPTNTYVAIYVFVAADSVVPLQLTLLYLRLDKIIYK